MRKNPLAAYENAAMEGLTGGELEAAVLTKAAMLIKDCMENPEGKRGDEKLMEALRNNQKLWTFLQVELTSKNHPMPANIRQNLLNLSIFIDKRTFELMADPDPAKMKVLIDINLNIAAGLREGAQKARAEKGT